MRRSASRNGVTVQAIAGTHSVLLGFDVDGLDPADPADSAPRTGPGTGPGLTSGLLGFGIRRTDHTEDERTWLRGLKVFPSVEPDPSPGESYSTRRHPIQGFQWGDYTAKPGHTYTYRVAALTGRPAAPTIGAWVDVKVRTEVEDNGVHGVWFNRGVAASQAWSRRYDDPTIELANPHSSAWAWLSRGLGEAFTGLCATAADGRWALRGAFYEFTWPDGLEALGAAAGRGADVQLVIHGRDRDPATATEDNDDTAADNQAAVAAAGIDHLVTWRRAPNKSSLQHNKFLVVLHDGQPVAVWTGSTNLTRGGIFGHSNVGHLIHDPEVAAAFLAYWDQLRAEVTTPQLRTWAETANPLADQPVGSVFSPRATASGLLQRFAARFDSARSSAHITGAFGLNEVFRDLLTGDRPYPRTVLLDKRPTATAPIPRTDPNVRVVWGGRLARGLGQWADEHLTGFNGHVPYVHLKLILVDPLTDHPVVVTGSANYSKASSYANEENTVVLAGTGTSPAFAPAEVQRVADIYLTEYERLFTHHVSRAITEPQPAAAGLVPTGGRGLAEDDSWLDRYRQGWRAGQRRLFAGTA